MLASLSGKSRLGTPLLSRRDSASGVKRPSLIDSVSKGTPRTLGDGICWSLPSIQSEAVRAEGETNSDSKPRSRQSSTAHGTRARKESAPSSTETPAKAEVSNFPPVLLSDSKISICVSGEFF